MGYDKVELQEVWSAWRHEFPVTENLVYLNHAAVAPLPLRVANAMKGLADDGCAWGSLHYDKWLACYDGLRSGTAQLVNAVPGEIALVKNTSEGIATVALGFDWKPGDRVVGFREEFPANYYIWKKLEEWKGVRVEWLSYLDPPERIEEAARGARLLAISFVQYLSGYRANLKAIGEICRHHHVFFFVDAIQGLGVYPFDVKELDVNGFAADGHKWLLGPEGCGVLYVSQEWQDRIEPVEFGWTNVAGYADYASRDMTPRRDAGRYECGTLNTIGCFGLRAAVELILEVGVDQISRQVTGLTRQISRGAEAKGYEVLGGWDETTASGIVSIRKPGLDSRAVCAQLREARITSAPRQGWIRLSPHFYISPDEIERVIGTLP